MNNMQKYTKIMYIYKKIQINTLQDKKIAIMKHNEYFTAR